ncbi:50S ribosomal protein L33 [Candidatus Mycoplasma haematolamae str. Purdue]|uniref:Large ribosomal subunit protein bL33 n=1 Tax=Mycoplasma haematolamae (strain Purdue) TaxID=1212765 RepID=I7C7E0_MYCHA|nr:50S ribosomal protein L33 [Candidatus Mycoplasma haematolamae]AFO52447.1 50S ribosomal protein L33 [Candidatus Mycoplasma haematolamae str. Purdue]
MGVRVPILFKCSNCNFIYYLSEKSIDKTVTNKKLELNKFCKKCRQHCKHIETKPAK